MTERVMRASDQDREEAIRALSDAFADGRLDHAEFETRMESAQGATYLHDLDPLFADLPARTRTPQPVQRDGFEAFPGRRPAWSPILPLLLIAVLTTVLLTTGHVWVLFPLWFLGVRVAHRIAWRRRAMAYAALPGRPGEHRGRMPHGPHGW